MRGRSGEGGVYPLMEKRERPRLKHVSDSRFMTIPMACTPASSLIRGFQHSQPVIERLLNGSTHPSQSRIERRVRIRPLPLSQPGQLVLVGDVPVVCGVGLGI